MKRRHFGIIAAILILQSVAVAEIGENWTKATDNAGWSERDYLSAASHNGSMFITAGLRSDSYELCDVWKSTNGSYWELIFDQEFPCGDFPARDSHPTLSFDNKLWILGGYGWLDDLNDAWYSPDDGVSWHEKNSSNAWGKRHGHGAAVLNGSAYIFGGAYYNDLNDTWKSNGTDLGNWTYLGDAPFTARKYFGYAVFQNKIWVFGGSSWEPAAIYNDLWSFNGTGWTLEAEHANWSARAGHIALATANEVCIIGGTDTNNSDLNDVWCSQDGKSFTLRTSSANFSARGYFAGTVFDDRLWIMGGNSIGTVKNDVWYSVGSNSGLLQKQSFDEKSSKTPKAKNYKRNRR